MKVFHLLILIYTSAVLYSCRKSEPTDCHYEYTSGVIKAIAGPDSMRVNERNELTLDVDASGLCVADIITTVTPYLDSMYYIEVKVKYSSGANKNCDCEVKDHHYVRVYFSSPIKGNIALSTIPGIGSSAGHTVKVY